MENMAGDLSEYKKTARIGGFWYLLVAVFSAIGIVYVPSRVIIEGNAIETANRILASESLFRFGIISNLIGQISFLFAVLAFYQLFKDVSKKYAGLMVSLVIVAVPMAFLNEIFSVAALRCLRGAEDLRAFEPNQLKAMAMGLLHMHENGIVIVEIFWGLWLFPFGYLIIKSGFMPKFLGVLLMIGGFSYLIDSSLALMMPQSREAIKGMITLPSAAGEILTLLWLLIIGVRRTRRQS